MSIRLNKALRELNIGLQTAVEFLEKRSELGEVKAEPSFKLSDAQYSALAGAFQQDKERRRRTTHVPNESFHRLPSSSTSRWARLTLTASERSLPS